MKLKLLLLTCLLSLSFAHARDGSGSSGGGGAVVCFEESEMKSARLLDFYEGKNIFGDSFISNHENMTYQELLEIAVKRLEKSAYGLSTGINRSRSIRQIVSHIEKTKRFVSKEVALNPVYDSFEVFVPRNCKILQAAVFIDDSMMMDGTILFDQNIWDKLSEFDKAGLIIHEAVYWVDRMYSYRYDSRRARRVVSNIFTENLQQEDIKDGIPSTYTLCETAKWGLEEGLALTAFVQFIDNNEYVVQFLVLDGDPVLSKKTMSLGSVRVQEFDSYGLSGSHTSSLYEDHDKIDINFHKVQGSNAVSVSMASGKKLSYPSRKFPDQKLRCQPCDSHSCKFLNKN